jgi:hypothetical protein
MALCMGFIIKQLAWKSKGPTNVKHRALILDLTKILETAYDIKLREMVQLWFLI